jgi:hypothetical protein
VVAEKRLIAATYRGASAVNSRCHPLSATSTRRTPSEKLNARVRSATALPQATVHASSALSSAGERCRAFAMIDSNAAEARFNVALQYRERASRNEYQKRPGRIDCNKRDSNGHAQSASSQSAIRRLQARDLNWPSRSLPLPQPQPSPASSSVSSNAPPNTDSRGSASLHRGKEPHPRHRTSCSRRSTLPRA